MQKKTISKRMKRILQLNITYRHNLKQFKNASKKQKKALSL
jgi:hypothetical protein